MKSKISFFIRLIIAVIFLQTLYFKFTGAPQSVHIFETLGMEPIGRILIGVIELIIGITILIPKTKLKATYAALVVILGAIGAHIFTPLGIEVRWSGQSDNGATFTMALIVLVLCILSLLVEKRKN